MIALNAILQTIKEYKVEKIVVIETVREVLLNGDMTDDDVKATLKTIQKAVFSQYHSDLLFEYNTETSIFVITLYLKHININGLQQVLDLIKSKSMFSIMHGTTGLTYWLIGWHLFEDLATGLHRYTFAYDRREASIVIQNKDI